MVEGDGLEGRLAAVQLEELVRLSALLRQARALVSRDSLRKVEVVGEVAVGREFEGTRQVGLELLLLLRRQAHEVQPATFGLRLAHERAHVVGDVERAQRRIVRDGAGDAIELAHVEHAVLERDLRSVLLGKRVEVGEPERGIVAAEGQEHVVDGGFIFQVQRSEFHGPAFRSIGCFAAEQDSTSGRRLGKRHQLATRTAPRGAVGAATLPIRSFFTTLLTRRNILFHLVIGLRQDGRKRPVWQRSYPTSAHGIFLVKPDMPCPVLFGIVS